MGILNLTPDSFYDQGAYFSDEKGIKKAYEMIDDGADIIDIGGSSSRPDASLVSAEEEERRVLPVLSQINGYAKEKKVLISIDTTHPKLAQKAISLGAALINDIYGFENRELVNVARESKTLICVMHMQGTPQTMQINPHYPKGVIVEIEEWFEKRIASLLDQGIEEKQIIIDPGIGFGKTVDDNLTILKHLPRFKKWRLPILIGLSRKSFMAKILQKATNQLLSTTIAANTMCLLSGAEIIRVHDVKEHVDVKQFIKRIRLT